MRAYVGYATSVLFWLKNRMDQTNRENVVCIKSLGEAAYLASDLASMELDRHGFVESTMRGWPERGRKHKQALGKGLTGPVMHVLVPNGVDSNQIEGFERHRWASFIPDGSFCRLTRNVYVSTPEFSFLQLAGLLSQTQLILVGYWLCASYRVRDDGVTIPAEPVTTVKRLRQYLEQAEGCYGTRKALRALNWIIDNARSPMEIKTAMLVSLPIRLGGYALGKPVLNYAIDAKDFDSKTLDRPDRKAFEVDLYWAKQHVGVEYDGSDHLEPARVRADKRRINCLLANGERILVVMVDQLSDPYVRETLMTQLAKLLRVQKRKANDDARDALEGLLFRGEFSL